MSRIRTGFRPATILSTGLVVIVPVLTAHAAEGPEPQEEQELELEAVVVTGSRIVRRDYEANSPIVTVGDEVLEQSSTTALEVNLNKLPQFNAAQTPTTSYGDIQQTATNTPGAATVALRGIGPNRNLVLLDGRRATPGSASMVVDINTIPAAAIDRVEIITGGASSTYGADAVGGVVNFIMKKDFEGFHLDGQYGLSQRGDAEESSISGILGANFAEQRGNVTLSFSKQKRMEALRQDRSWFRDVWRDPSTATGGEFFPDFPAFSPIGTNTPDQDVLNDLFSGRPNPSANVSENERIYFNPDGTAFTGFAFSSSAGAYRFSQPTDGLKWKLTDDGLISQNYIAEQLQVPMDRSNVFLLGNYDITDNVGVFARGMFNRSEVNTIQQPAPAVNGWSANIPVDGREVPDELADVLASRDDPAGDWQLYQYMNFADRTARTDVFTWNMLAGLQGRFFSDWTWEVFGSQGESETNSFQTGFVSLERYRTIIRSADWGEGFTATGNGSQGGFGASTATCTSGLNPFMPVAQISQDCIEAISADIKSRSAMKQTVWEANAQGGLLDLPAGQLRGAIGAAYRKNDYEFLNDTLTTQGRSFEDQALGLYPSGNSRGRINVKELYGELLVPLLAGLPAVRRLELELGARTSDFNTTGSSLTWKALLSWEANDRIRFRGGYNKAERAPNIGELFLAPQQTFAFSAGGDVCSLNNSQPWSANPTAMGNTPENAAAVEALCRTLMNGSGDPQTGDNFYNDPGLQLAGGGFVFPTTKGNPDLSPEKAGTWTLGAVLRSPWDAPALSGLSVALDYYNIKVNDAIGVQSYDIAQRQCFDVAFNPTLDPDTVSCRNITRNITVGTLGNVAGTYVNNGRFRTSGVDMQVNWSMPVGPGMLGATTAANYLIDMKSAALSVTPLVEFAGTFGGANNGPASNLIMENGLNSNFFRWKMFNTISYGAGPWTASLQWQHLPKIKSAESARDPATFIKGAPAYDLLGLNGTYKLSDKAMLRVGIDNLLDKAPPVGGVNVNPALPAGLLPGGAVNIGSYDGLGRRFYAGAKIAF